MKSPIEPKLTITSLNYNLSVTRRQINSLIRHQTIELIGGVSNVGYSGDTCSISLTCELNSADKREGSLIECLQWATQIAEGLDQMEKAFAGLNKKYLFDNISFKG